MVSFRVLVAPGLIVTLLMSKPACQVDVGGVARIVMLELGHAVVSVLVREMVYVVAVPAGTAGVLTGLATTRGAERVHPLPALTRIVAAVSVTATVLIVVPVTGSVKLLPTSRSASP